MILTEVLKVEFFKAVAVGWALPPNFSGLSKGIKFGGTGFTGAD
jgi:hypothetical protein